MKNDGWKEWPPIAGVAFGAAAVVLVLATTTITNSIVSGIKDDVWENGQKIDEMEAQVRQMQTDLAEFQLETTLSLQRIELQLQQVFHGDESLARMGLAVLEKSVAFRTK